MPVLFDEWAHVACYNNFELKEDPNVRNFWGQSLDSMWTCLFEADGGLGGAIWCMLDETFMLPEDLEGFNRWWGILDKRVIPATFMRPTVGYGEWGIMDTWRRKTHKDLRAVQRRQRDQVKGGQDDVDPGKIVEQLRRNACRLNMKQPVQKSRRPSRETVLRRPSRER